ncbi:MAG: NUDIX domain-containing protein [Salinivirgaceae bacterium]|jgi:8-oxo-dGTP diphosphatase|nr:NUDIX domain-containing protein [Salinivirgaceae bacterium]
MTRKLLTNLSVDCVIFGFDMDQLKVLLVERKLKSDDGKSIIFSDHSLTGYHIYEDEDLDSAAIRIVNDLTGLENLKFEQFYTFGSLDRIAHPNDQIWIEQFGDVISSRVLTVGYYSLLPNTNMNIIQKGRKVNWFPVDQVKELAYDHKEILEKALEHLRYKLQNEPVGFNLLPEKFTLSQMQKLYEAILGAKYDKRNFRKKVSQMSYVVPIKEKQQGVAHKPAQLYIFSPEVYEKTRKERNHFFI